MGYLILLLAFLVGGIILSIRFRKAEILRNELRSKCHDLESALEKATRERREFEDELTKFSPLIRELKTSEAIQNQITERGHFLSTLDAELTSLRKTVNVHAVHKELQESGFFNYKYHFEDVAKYREALAIVREVQKEMISSGSAFSCHIQNLSETPLVNSLAKLALMVFHAEFELVLNSLNYSNFDSCRKRVESVFEKINKHLSPFCCEIVEPYLNSKEKELAIALEYELEEQKKKEQQQDLRARMRDEERARAESEERIEAAAVKFDKKVEADRLKLAELGRKEAELIALGATAENSDLKREVEALRKQLEASQAETELVREEFQREVSNAQKTRKGYVYIISNIGSFGEEVFKIGMTRRDKAADRVDELSGASVPFRFDIHATIKTDDAPALEHQLHKHLDSFRMNRVNTRREFFRVPIKTIEDVCKKVGCQVEMTYMADAREYRETLALKSDGDEAA